MVWTELNISAGNDEFLAYVLYRDIGKKDSKPFQQGVYDLSLA